MSSTSIVESESNVIIDYHTGILNSSNFNIISSKDNIILIEYNSGIKFKYELKPNLSSGLIINLSSGLVIIEAQSIDSLHILRLFAKKFGLDYLLSTQIELSLDIFDSWIEFFDTENNPENQNYFLKPQMYKYCTICGVPTQLTSINICTCSNPDCIKKSYHIVTNPIVTSYYKYDKITCKFLIQSLITCLYHPKGELAFNPFPNIIGCSTITDIKNILPNYFNDFELEKLFNLILEHEDKDELELYKSIDNVSYSIIKNALSNNYFSLGSHSIDKDNSVYFVDINYPVEVEKKFSDYFQFLFHGSAFYSWYPIIKNGLKVLSGTALQANGAVYGPGIYFSNDISFAASYSSKPIVLSNGTQPGQPIKLSIDKYVIGIFRISKPIETFYKAPKIYVVPDDSVLLLKSLVIIKNKCSDTQNIFKHINDRFMKFLPQEMIDIKMNSLMVKNKRLNNELKIINTNSEYKIEIVNESQWKLLINSNEFQLNFLNYPAKAPNIVLTNGTFPENCLDSNKNVKIPILHPASWTISNNLIQIFAQIKEFM